MDPGFPREGAPFSEGGCTSLLFSQIFAKNCIKWKIWTERGRLPWIRHWWSWSFRKQRANAISLTLLCDLDWRRWSLPVLALNSFCVRLSTELREEDTVISVRQPRGLIQLYYSHSISDFDTLPTLWIRNFQWLIFFVYIFLSMLSGDFLLCQTFWSKIFVDISCNICGLFLLWCTS